MNVKTSDGDNSLKINRCSNVLCNYSQKMNKMK
jgi:hypothetical protein